MESKVPACLRVRLVSKDMRGEGQPLVKARNSKSVRGRWCVALWTIAALGTCTLALVLFETKHKKIGLQQQQDMLTTLSREPAGEQVSLKISTQLDDSWEYLATYASENTEPLLETYCSAREDGAGDVTVHGSGSASIYNVQQAGYEYFDTRAYYSSPYLHHCTLSGLKPKTKYWLKVGNSSAQYDFITSPLPGPEQPFTFAVVADAGQTEYSAATYKSVSQLVSSKNVSTLVWPGDLSYADGNHYRWDSFGRLVTELLARVELIAAPGNHELEHSENFIAYTARYARGSLWHVDSRGPVTFISLNSYSRFDPKSPQYRWLESTLESVDRKKTPWLIVQFHAPIYSSNDDHMGEARAFRKAFEPLFVKYKVDVALSGHVHSYERTHPVSDGSVTPCGTTYITIGDGGNREGLSRFWWPSQPSWSAFRHAMYGFGYMSVYNGTVAKWAWHSDSVAMLRHGNRKEETDTVILDRSSCRS